MIFVSLVPGEVHIQDLSLLFTEGELVNIPPDKALASRDLWRAVNQRLLFQIRKGLPSETVPVLDQSDRVSQLEQANAHLERSLMDVRVELEGVRKQLQEAVALANQRQVEVQTLQQALQGRPADPRIDQLFEIMMRQSQQGVPFVAPPSAGSAPVAPATPGVDLDPQVVFVPTFEKPKEVRVTVQEGESSEGGAAAAREALRKLRGR